MEIEIENFHRSFSTKITTDYALLIVSGDVKKLKIQ
jgi:hypothetical protein